MAWNPEVFRDYCREHNKEYEPVFWSGSSQVGYDEQKPQMTARQAAEDHCSNHPECKTVGELVDAAGDGKDFNQFDTSIDWEETSKIFAEESSGQWHIYIGEINPRSDSVYMGIERAAISGNDKLNDSGNVYRVTSDGIQPKEECSRDDLPYFGQDGLLVMDGGKTSDFEAKNATYEDITNNCESAANNAKGQTTSSAETKSEPVSGIIGADVDNGSGVSGRSDGGSGDRGTDDKGADHAVSDSQGSGGSISGDGTDHNGSDYKNKGNGNNNGIRSISEWENSVNNTGNENSRHKPAQDAGNSARNESETSPQPQQPTPETQKTKDQEATQKNNDSVQDYLNRIE